MSNTTTATIKTKANARAEAITTALTINWEGMEQADIIALAQQSLVIKLQSQWRNAEAIPTEATVNAADYKIGVRAPKKPADVMALVNKLSPEERAALLAKLTA